ncbi:MAG: hypothetical protein KatS3mg108_0722 [Isosphaeraceae bacterium]|jgi:hypothetical protein|nr:MAG: hypothetical protein KatS3mg108_0722 [Isosphaeraceae bacterium]
MRWLAPVVFAAIFFGHFAYLTRSTAGATGQGQWAAYEFDEPDDSRVGRYLDAGNQWLGLSYAASGAFAAWCFARLLRQRREAVAASAGGLTLSGVLVAGVCFLTGCCGSPMLPLYLGLLGPKFLSVTKPLAFAITLLSIALGYAWMLRGVCKVPAKNVNPRLHETAGADPGEI